jgi:hypothetical protein
LSEVIDTNGRVLMSAPGLGKEAGRLRVLDARGRLKVALTADAIDSESASDSWVLVADGAGGAAWEAVPGGSAPGPHDMLTGHTYSGGAALDVFETEPLPAEDPLWGMNNVIITPHMAGSAGPVYPGRKVDISLDNLFRYLEGQPLRNVVDKKEWH